MIRKIKKYKISVRPHGVLRLLKKKVSRDADPAEMEKKISLELERVQPLLHPSSVYASFSRAETPEVLKDVWKTASRKALSLSVLLSSVGPDLEKELDKAKAENNDLDGAVLEAIGQESLDESLRFVTKLLAEEAKQESCELSPVLPADPSLWSALLPLLESHKADISLDDNGRMAPLYTSASYCFWNPLPKGKNASSR